MIKTTTNKILDKINSYFKPVATSTMLDGVYYTYKIPSKAIRLQFHANTVVGDYENITVTANIACHKRTKAFKDLNDAINACLAYAVVDGIVLEK